MQAGGGEGFGHYSKTIQLIVMMLWVFIASKTLFGLTFFFLRTCPLSRKKEVQGLCLQAHELYLKEVFEPALIEDFIQAACLNCQDRIKQFVGDISNFGFPTIAASNLDETSYIWMRLFCFVFVAAMLLCTVRIGSLGRAVGRRLTLTLVTGRTSIKLCVLESGYILHSLKLSSGQ